MANIQKMPINCDLSEASFGDACGRLGEMPRDCLLVCPTSQAAHAQIIEEHYNCNVVLIPVDMLATPFAWGANCGTDWVWSPGIA